MIKINQLTYRYQSMTFNFDLNVNKGESIAIVGPSGAGKSSLLSLIAGFIEGQSGELILAGVDHLTTLPAQRPVSMLFQENNLFAHLNVQQNMALGLSSNMVLTAADLQQLEEMANAVGLADLLGRKPSELSGGQRQRVAIARALLRQQPILLLDEPFSALDPALRQEMLMLVQQVVKERSLTLLMVSHNLEDAAMISPRTLLINHGRIVFDGATEQLMRGDVAQAALIGIKSPLNRE